jgi:hypothetical protein
VFTIVVIMESNNQFVVLNHTVFIRIDLLEDTLQFILVTIGIQLTRDVSQNYCFELILELPL